MSTPLTPLPIRLFCDLAARMQTLVDLNTGAPPQFVRGDENSGAGALMSSTVAAGAMNLGLTAGQWTGNAAPSNHAAFVFPNAQTVVSLGGQPSANLWLRITLQTADAVAKVITLAQGPMTVYDGPVTGQSPALYSIGLASVSGVPSVSLGSAALPAFTGNCRFFTVSGVQVWQVKNSGNGLFYTVGVENVGGVPTLYLSNAGYE
jgi:hypothetical protein